MIGRLASLLRGPTLLRDTVLAGGGMGIARLASLATLVLLTRILPTAEFGAYALGWATWLLTSQLVGGLDLALVDARARAEDDGVLVPAYWSLKLRGSLLLCVLSVAALPLVGVAASWGAAGTRAAVAGGLSGAATTLYQSRLSVAQAQQRFGAYARGWVALNTAVLAASGLLAVSGVRSALPYVALYGAVPLALLVDELWRARPHDRTAVAAARTALLRDARWLLPSGVLNSLGNRADVFVASAMLAAGSFAVYGAAVRFFGLFQFALTSMGSVLLPRASRLARHGGVRAYLAGAAGITGAVALAGALCIWQADPFARLLVGHRYAAAAADLMPALVVAAVLLAFNVTLGFLLFTVRRPGSFTLMTGLVLIAKVVAAVVLIPHVGTEGAAWSLAAGYAAGDLFLLAVVAHGWRRRPAAHDLPVQADFA